MVEAAEIFMRNVGEEFDREVPPQAGPDEDSEM
jgi:hypothetical protein